MAESQKPNILFIMADDIGWFNASCYHHGVMGYQTPNIDRIAKEGAPPLLMDWLSSFKEFPARKVGQFHH